MIVSGDVSYNHLNPPAVLAAPRCYLGYYGQLPEVAVPGQELPEAMVNRYPGWVSGRR